MNYLDTGKLIKHLLNERNMTQDNLADHLNISKSAVSKNLNGKSGFDLSNLVEISKLFGITLDELVEGKMNVSDTPTDYEKAVLQGLHAVRTIAKSHQSVNTYDIKGNSMLFYAIKHNATEVFEFLFKGNYHPELLYKTRSSYSLINDPEVARFIVKHQLTSCLVESLQFEDGYPEMNETLAAIEDAEFLAKIKHYWPEDVLMKAIALKNDLVVTFYLENKKLKKDQKALDHIIAQCVAHDADDYLEKIMHQYKDHQVNVQTIIENCSKEQVQRFLKKYA